MCLLQQGIHRCQPCRGPRVSAVGAAVSLTARDRLRNISGFLVKRCRCEHVTGNFAGLAPCECDPRPKLDGHNQYERCSYFSDHVRGTGTHAVLNCCTYATPVAVRGCATRTNRSGGQTAANGLCPQLRPFHVPGQPQRAQGPDPIPVHIQLVPHESMSC
jgi:hypothetical protein